MKRQNMGRKKKREVTGKRTGREASRIREAYREAWAAVERSRSFILCIAGAFVASMLYGFVFPEQFTFFNEMLRKILEESEGLSGQELMAYIFLNNLQSSFLGMALGIVLGIFPVLVTLVNGSLIGYVLRLSWEQSGLSEFWRLLPHGIFELPAVFLALALGLRMGMFVFEQQKLAAFKERVADATLVFVFFVVPLLIIAAVIEGALIAWLG